MSTLINIEVLLPGHVLLVRGDKGQAIRVGEKTYMMGRWVFLCALCGRQNSAYGFTVDDAGERMMKGIGRGPSGDRGNKWKQVILSPADIQHLWVCFSCCTGLWGIES